MNIRETVVAGSFYPAAKDELEGLLEELRKNEEIDYSYINKDLIGAIIPHAGYIYSAHHAIHFFDLLNKTKIKYDTIIVINPSHSGIGEDISLTSYKYWDTPLGKVEVDLEFQNLLPLPYNNRAQSREHSGEVMLPLLRHFIPYDFKVVPICFKSQNYQNAKKLAKLLYEAQTISHRKILIVASSDFSHYVPSGIGVKLDNIALNEINKFDSKTFQDEVYRHRLTICGFGPIMTLMEYSKLSHKDAKNTILSRGNSGDVVAMVEVVDYVTVLFYSD